MRRLSTIAATIVTTAILSATLGFSGVAAAKAGKTSAWALTVPNQAGSHPAGCVEGLILYPKGHTFVARRYGDGGTWRTGPHKKIYLTWTESGSGGVGIGSTFGGTYSNHGPEYAGAANFVSASWFYFDYSADLESLNVPGAKACYNLTL